MGQRVAQRRGARTSLGEHAAPHCAAGNWRGFGSARRRAGGGRSRGCAIRSPWQRAGGQAESVQLGECHRSSGGHRAAEERRWAARQHAPARQSARAAANRTANPHACAAHADNRASPPADGDATGDVDPNANRDSFTVRDSLACSEPYAYRDAVTRPQSERHAGNDANDTAESFAACNAHTWTRGWAALLARSHGTPSTA